MPRMYPFITGIKADYLISSHFSVDNFIFIIKANAQGELKCDFLCCSIFEKGDRELNVKVGQFYLTINKNMAESLGITTVSITKAHGRNLDKGKGVGEKSLVVRDY